VLLAANCDDETDGGEGGGAAALRFPSVRRIEVDGRTCAVEGARSLDVWADIACPRRNQVPLDKEIG
jgi:hypothetical protein